jgi:hypothetical protein
LIIAFDNIDRFTDKEQNIIIDYAARLVGGRSGINVILTIRPNTTTLKSRLSDFYGETRFKVIHVLCPNVFDIIKKRLSTDRKGRTIDLDDNIPGSIHSWNYTLRKYINSDNYRGLAGFVRDLCSTSSLSNIANIQYSIKIHTTDYGKDYYQKLDIRHYLKLFNRILLSNSLKDFENIDNLYFGIQSLMIRDSGRMEESESFLFNLFDNEMPHLPGNALIRYRVLEYIKSISILDVTFDEFFDILGYGSKNARNVLNMFIDANLIDLVNNRIQNAGELRGILTIPGERHFEVVTNLWYMICAKTGMNIYEECIKYGDEAKKLAAPFVRSQALLDYYANHGWVPEIQFINYIADQERLEAIRIESNLQGNTNQRLVNKITNLLSNLSSPSYNLYEGYHTQLKYWTRK